MATDEDVLASDFIARNPTAFERVYAMHGRALHAVARNVLGSDAAAEDCVHEALLRVWGTPDSYRRERGPLRTFLIVCARNEALSVMRGDARRVAREEHVRRLAPVSTTVEVADHIEAQRVHSALGALPGEQRAALELVYYRNQTQAEAAAQLGVPLGTLKSRISLGIRRLHTLLAGPEVAS